MSSWTPTSRSEGLRRELPGALAARLAGSSVAITFVTLGELTKWTLVRSWGPRRLAALERFLERVVVLPYNRRVARR
jgi:predicted nucleic acid-binding protein